MERSRKSNKTGSEAKVPIKKIILVDSNELCYIALHSQGYLSYGGRPTGVIFGFLRKVLELAKLFENTNFVFCFDSTINIRKAAYPSYKEKRYKEDKLTDDQLEGLIYGKEQFITLRKHILPSLGFNNIYFATGFESDDIIAHICKTWENYYFVIVSSDEDLYQLLNSHTTIYKPRAKKYFGYSKFVDKYDISPNQWSRVKAIAGCTSDNVCGVSGVGEKTAISYLKGKLKVGSKNWYNIQKCNAIIESNMGLVDLPHKKLNGSKFIYGDNNFDYSNFLRIFDYYGFASFLKNPLINEWRYWFFEK